MDLRVVLDAFHDTVSSAPILKTPGLKGAPGVIGKGKNADLERVFAK